MASREETKEKVPQISEPTSPRSKSEPNETEDSFKSDTAKPENVDNVFLLSRCLPLSFHAILRILGYSRCHENQTISPEKSSSKTHPSRRTPSNRPKKKEPEFQHPFQEAQTGNLSSPFLSLLLFSKSVIFRVKTDQSKKWTRSLKARHLKKKNLALFAKKEIQFTEI